jgi:hypothetical protein
MIGDVQQTELQTVDVIADVRAGKLHACQFVDQIQARNSLDAAGRRYDWKPR